MSFTYHQCGPQPVIHTFTFTTAVSFYSCDPYDGQCTCNAGWSRPNCTDPCDGDSSEDWSAHVHVFTAVQLALTIMFLSSEELRKTASGFNIIVIVGVVIAICGLVLIGLLLFMRRHRKRQRQSQLLEMSR